MGVKLHRCSSLWVKVGVHPCWTVQKALEAQGIEYAIVKGTVRRSKRSDLEALSGQRLYPVLEFDDGSLYRQESKDMAKTISEGRLMEKSGSRTAPPTSG